MGRNDRGGRYLLFAGQEMPGHEMDTACVHRLLRAMWVGGPLTMQEPASSAEPYCRRREWKSLVHVGLGAVHSDPGAHRSLRRCNLSCFLEVLYSSTHISCGSTQRGHQHISPAESGFHSLRGSRLWAPFPSVCAGQAGDTVVLAHGYVCAWGRWHRYFWAWDISRVLGDCLFKDSTQMYAI